MTIMKSRYLDQFKSLRESGKENYELPGDFLIVEKLTEEERKTASGLVMVAPGQHRNTLESQKASFCIVLAVGEGYYDDETKEPIDLETKPGDIILIGEVSARYFSFFGDLQNYEPYTVGITKESEIQMRFRGEEGYRKAFEILNQSAKKQVEGQG